MFPSCTRFWTSDSPRSLWDRSEELRATRLCETTILSIPTLSQHVGPFKDTYSLRHPKSLHKPSPQILLV